MINGIKPLPPKEDFDIAVDNLLKNIVIKFNEWMPDSYRECKPILVNGRKFIKVIEDNSVWGFIAKKDGEHKGLTMKAGDVFKPAGWAAAAKYTRGNIFDNNTDWFAWTGPNYLR